MKKVFSPIGGLDFDSSEIFIEEGDYVDAENVLVNVSKNGNKGSFKKIPGWELLFDDWVTDFKTNVDIDAQIDTFIQKGLVLDQRTGEVYALFYYRDFTTPNRALALVKFSADGLSYTALVSANSLGLTENDFQETDAQLRLIGDMLVWKSENQIYKWYINRTILLPYTGGQSETEVLYLANDVPHHTLVTFVAGSDDFPELDFQFAHRYFFDSGEFSVLGPISPMLHRTQATGYVTLEAAQLAAYANNTLVTDPPTIPILCTKVVFYARVGSEGQWFKVGEKTRAQAISVTASDRELIFNGTLLSALSVRDGINVFNAIPIKTGTLESVNGRIMLADYQSFYEEETIDIAFDVDGDGGTGDRVLIEGQYSYGLILFDEKYRNQGVIRSVNYEQGSTTTNGLPGLRITFTTVPSWVKYYGIARTNNQTYQNYWSSYYDDVFYIFENSAGDTKYTYSPTNDQTPQIKLIAVDIASSLNKKHFYSFQEGDLARVDELGGEFYRVVGVDGSLILLEPKQMGAARLIGNSEGRIIIASPSSGQEDNVFYEIGPRMYIPESFPETRYVMPPTVSPTAFGSSITDVNDIEDEVFIEGDFFDILQLVFPNAASHQTYNGTFGRIDASNNLVNQATVNGTFFFGAGPGAEPSLPNARSYIQDDFDRNPTINRGFPFVEIPEDVSVKFKNQILIGGRFVDGLRINKINQFFSTDIKEMPPENGTIKKLILTNKIDEMGAILLVLSTQEASSVYINESELQQTSGSPIISKTDLILGNDNTLKGGYGTLHPDSAFAYEGQVFWWNEEKKRVVRYAQNGLVPISDIKAQTYFLNKTGDCRIWIDPYTRYMYVGFLSDTSCLAFDLINSRWKCQLTTRPPSLAIVYNQNSLMGYRGLLYQSNQGSSYNKFFGPDSGDPYNPSITSENSSIEFVVSERGLPLLLERIAILFQEDFITANKTIKTNLFTIVITNENGQQTTLIDQNFLLDEKVIYGHVFRDENSAGGLIEGDFVIGSFNRVKITILDTAIEGIIDAIIVDFMITQGHGI